MRHGLLALSDGCSSVRAMLFCTRFPALSSRFLLARGNQTDPLSLLTEIR